MKAHLQRRRQLLLHFGYDGSRFHGLQPQGPQFPTAGEALRTRLHEAAGTKPRGMAFAARTDRGVHADRNVATCFFDTRDDDVDTEAVVHAVAVERDDGLRAVRAYAVSPHVHARALSRGKRYRYLVQDDVDAGVLDRDHATRWQVHPHLDIERMQAAADLLLGTHDYSSFRASGCSAGSATKTLVSLRVQRDVVQQAGVDVGVVAIELVGDAFLRKMVRNIAALLLEVGTGWRPIDDVTPLLQARDRNAAGLTAPPGGLTLVEVGCAWPDDGSALLPEMRGFVWPVSSHKYLTATEPVVEE